MLQIVRIWAKRAMWSACEIGNQTCALASSQALITPSALDMLGESNGINEWDALVGKRSWRCDVMMCLWWCLIVSAERRGETGASHCLTFMGNCSVFQYFKQKLILSTQWFNPKCQPYKMVKHTQTIRREFVYLTILWVCRLKG